VEELKKIMNQESKPSGRESNTRYPEHEAKGVVAHSSSTFGNKEYRLEVRVLMRSRATHRTHTEGKAKSTNIWPENLTKTTRNMGSVTELQT